MGAITLLNMIGVQIMAAVQRDRGQQRLACVGIGGVAAHLIQLPKHRLHRRQRPQPRHQHLLPAQTPVQAFMGAITMQNMTIAQTQAHAQHERDPVRLVCVGIGGVAVPLNDPHQ